MDMKKLNREREQEIARGYRAQAEGLADDAQRKAAIDKVRSSSRKCLCLYFI